MWSQLCVSSTTCSKERYSPRCISRISVECPRVFELENAPISECVRSVTLRLSEHYRQLTSISSQGICFLRRTITRRISCSLHCFLAVLGLSNFGFLACERSASILLWWWCEHRLYLQHGWPSYSLCRLCYETHRHIWHSGYLPPMSSCPDDH